MAQFAASPEILHFSGLIAGQESVQVLSIINRSAISQRLLIIPPTTEYFRIEYEKQGLLAPGMSQKITVKFYPTEFKYYYDTINIRSEVDNLLIPIHGYPVINKIDFPSKLSFGSTPLCEPVTKRIRLKCTIPINFSYTLEILKPHPYMKITPLRGVIPANGHTDILLTFHPITLESVMSTLLLRVDQNGFVPMECIVTAKAISGLIESKALVQAEVNVLDYAVEVGSKLNNTLGPNSTFQGTLNRAVNQLHKTDTLNMSKEYPPIDYSQTKVGQSLNILERSRTKNHFADPTATVLASTFHAADLNSVLDSAIQGTLLLKQKEPKGKTSEEPKVPMGPGSGAAFDAGSQWIDTKHQKSFKKKQERAKREGLKTESLLPTVNEDKIIDGFRIPPTLETTTAVNFVLTQERGKLKPKDLKAAIEKNRAEREMRALEQKKMREGTVGGTVGMLDLRAILGEERLNSEEGGPFKRQLRELTFLTEVDEVYKLEVEKGFRISEEYIGANILTNDEIKLVQEQRRLAEVHKKRSTWSQAISKQHSRMYLPTDSYVKAGSSADNAKLLASTLVPSFDSNTNDVWSKRMNTLRRFVALVSRWIVRRRIDDRLGMVKDALNAAGVTTWEQGRAFIAEENANYKSRPPVQSKSKSKITSNDEAVVSQGDAASQTLAAVVCAQPNPIQAQKLRNDTIISCEKFYPSKQMLRRNLFPRFIPDDSTSFSELPSIAVQELTVFDDRTLFQLKVKPEFISLQYEAFRVPTLQLTYQPECTDPLKLGAPEEGALRPAADVALAPLALLEQALPDPPTLAALRASSIENITQQPDPRHPEIPVPLPIVDEIIVEMPAWLCEEPNWSVSELDFLSQRPEFRTYVAEPRRNETNSDWSMRPLCKESTLVYDSDNSLRTKWSQLPGFCSINTYLLGGYESRCTDAAPLPGPTLADYYLPDLDRHRSGLCCFDSDHKRTLAQHDGDIRPLANKQDRHDVLTDSESDDEDGYMKPPPTLKQVNAMLRAELVDIAPIADDSKNKTGKGKAPAKGTAAPAPVAAPPIEVDDESNLIKEDQVELMRDRKILELESSQRRRREQLADSVRERLAELSKSSTCLLQALPVQIPFHAYEDNVYKLMEPRMPPVLSTFVIAGSPMSKLMTSPIKGISEEQFAFDGGLQECDAAKRFILEVYPGATVTSNVTNKMEVAIFTVMDGVKSKKPLVKCNQRDLYRKYGWPAKGTIVAHLQELDN